MKTTLILIIVLSVALTVWSFYAYTVETLSYEVIEKKVDYEIRKYRPYIAMQTEVENTNTNEAMSAGFRVLAAYIFGDNQGNKSVAMTAPVLEQENTKTTVAMTAPVLEQKILGQNNKRVITFTAPKEYTLETLPTPNSEKIKFIQIPEKKYAVHRFTWYYTDSRIEEKKKYLLELLKKDNFKILNEPMFAGYNGPGTIPFLMKNEILIEVE
jgi:anionic cell wall polymer biosynthesis LytR-Cps2A-Psr (LCP) family protein